MISNLEQVTAAWLAEVLTLPEESILSIEQTANNAFNSSIGHLAISYTADAPTDAPRRLLIKLNANGDGFEEAKFYRAVMALPDQERLSMLARCYAADLDEASGHSYCLLQDLSETHSAPVTRDQTIAGNGVPRPEHLEQIVQIIAQFHAYWWQHPLLGKGMAQVRWWYTDQTAFEAHVARRQNEWAKFKASVGDWFPADLIQLYEHILSSLPRFWDAYLKDRVLPLKHITLSEGDCYLSQFLCPKTDVANDHTYLVDFQDVSGNFAAYDLVYMFATFWTPEQRSEQSREDRLLRRYHEWLQVYGVTDFTYAQLFLDYQMMLTLMLFDPIWNQVSGSQQSYWWPKLQRMTDAFTDLRCAEALDRLL